MKRIIHLAVLRETRGKFGRRFSEKTIEIWFPPFFLIIFLFNVDLANSIFLFSSHIFFLPLSVKYKKSNTNNHNSVICKVSEVQRSLWFPAVQQFTEYIKCNYWHIQVLLSRPMICSLISCFYGNWIVNATAMKWFEL